MGIRFLCPTCGHKLNVKSFLAGKRGVCPQCGNGLDIPHESQIEKGSKGGQSVNVAAAQESPPVDLNTPIKVASAPGSLTIAPDSSKSGSHRVVTKPASRRAAAVSSEQPAKAAKSDSGLMAVPMQPNRPTQPAQPREASVPVAAPVESATPESVPPDPIDEAPEAIWYVRPPSGGEYGPARGEIMRKWLAEGRVSPESLVWREGWNDWCTAADVFPSLAAGISPPVPAPASPAGFVGPSPTARTSTRAALRPRRRNSALMAVTVVSVLGLMCLALFVALLLILFSSR